MTPNLETLVGAINRAHGTSLEAVGRFAAGEQGAYRLRDAGGGEWVLKWTPGALDLAPIERLARALDRLRAAGHRVPRIQRWGMHLEKPTGRYVIQEALPGEPLKSVDGPLLAQILDLNELQAGLGAGTAWETARGGNARWPALPVEDVLCGGDEYCLLETMRSHSSRTAALLASLQEFVEAHAARVALVVASGDLVHFDLNPANILTQGGHVTGVVDWDGVCPGESAFDLCTFLFFCYGPGVQVAPGVRERLWERAGALSGPGAAGVYLAHMAHRQVEWMARHYPDAVASWLSAVELVLRDAAQRVQWSPQRLLAWTGH